MYRSDINRELAALSHKHKLKESKGKAAVIGMLEELKKKKKTFCIDRSMIAGSAGKKTALENSDFDCVVFINDFEDSRRPAILKELETILKSETEARIEKTTEFAVKFKLGDFDVDLLPVGNFVTGDKNDTAAQQEEAVQAMIQKDPPKWYRYSAALAESQVGFIEKQSSFVHELVILCKYWNKSADIPGKVSGRSTLIELIAVHAGQEVERNYSNNKMYYGFLKFLLLMQDFSSLRICFDSSGNSVPISSQIKFTPPFVIEPANPFNNLAKNVNSAQICALKAKASETKRRLEQAERSWVSIESIFA